MLGLNEMDAVTRVLESGVIANGPESRAFEQEWAAHQQADESVLVSNGTTALQAALMVLADRNPYQKDVLVPAMSFNASSSAILAAGLRPVFVDITNYTHNIDPAKAKELITRNTLGIVAVDLYGLPADYEALSELGLPIIQDAAQSHGALLDGRPMGSKQMQEYYGIFATTFSFYATKNITTGGEGGAVLAPDWETISDIRMLREHGSTERYHHERAGYNWRVTELQAAIGREQLKRLALFQSQRKEVADHYGQGLHLYFDKPYISPTKNVEHGWHQYVVTVVPEYRDAIMKYMGSHGIGTAIHYPVADPRQPMYGYREYAYPNAEHLAQQAISLPMGPHVKYEDRVEVVRVANEALEWAQRHWEDAA
jgi:dTDP-4-amino-4,6-dideoxygalactose transaminase